MSSESVELRYAYLDGSAIVKLTVVEVETAALENDVARRTGILTSRLGVAEVRRAARRTGGRRLIQQVEDVLASFVVVDVTPAMFERAGALTPPALRTLDALHLATALAVELPSLDFITYDARLADAASRYGLRVLAPR